MKVYSRFVTGLSILVLAVAAGQYLWSVFSFELASKDYHPLKRHLSVFEDKATSLDIAEVLKPEYQDQFKRVGLNIVNFGLSRSVFWVRLDIPHFAHDSSEKEWFLEADKVLDDATLYQINQDGTWILQAPETGQRVNEYRIRYSTPTFAVKTREGDTTTYLMRLSNQSSFFVSFLLWDPNEFPGMVARTQFLHGAFFGGMTVMLLYNLFVWLVVRDITYLYYAMHLMGVTVVQFIDSGRAHQFLGQYAYFLTKEDLPFAIWWSWLFGTLFIQHFLELKTRHPVLNHILIVLARTTLICGLLSYIMPTHDSLLAAVAFSMIFLICIPLIGIYCYTAGNRTALFFNVAWCCNIGGYMIYSGVVLNTIDANPFSLSVMPIGSLLEVSLLSFVLGYRIKQLQSQTLAAHQRSMENLARFQSLFNNAAEGIYQISLKGDFTTANHSLLRQLGYNSLTALRQDNKRVRKLLFPNANKNLREMATKNSFIEEVAIQRHASDEKEAIHSAQLIRDRHGRPTHIEGTLIDITERRQSDRAQRERARERREKELAKLATDVKSDFLKKMSYEIRRLLSPVMGFSEAMRIMQLPDKEKSEVINTILSNGHSLLTLINDILDHSKIEAGKMPMEVIKTDLFTLVEKVHSSVERAAVRRGLHFEVQYTFPLPREIVTDPTRLRQSLENLCLHAVDVTLEGQVSVTVSWHEKSDRLQIDVQDGSKGLAPLELDDLFEVFSQTTPGNPRPSGSGLGLVIARRLMELMNGELEVRGRSRSGGTTFTMLLPCQPPPKSLWIMSRSPSITGKRQDKGNIPTLSGRVLVAEDNAVNQQLIQRVIRKTGALVIIASDGQKAIEECKRHSFDLILMDINMPVMGGLEATQTLRRMGHSGPIFALTAEQGQEEIAACHAAGCDGHLAKPLELDRFYKVLSSCLPSVGNPRQSPEAL